jgi:hypothetical protein
MTTTEKPCPTGPAGVKSGCVRTALGAPDYRYSPVLAKIKSFQGSLDPMDKYDGPNVAELVKILNSLATDLTNAGPGTDRFDKAEFLQMIILMLLARYSTGEFNDILYGRVNAAGDYSQKVLRLRDLPDAPDLIKKNYEYYNAVVTKFLVERKRLQKVWPRRGNLETQMKAFLNRATLLSNTNRQRLRNRHTVKIRTGVYDNINPLKVAVVDWSKNEPVTVAKVPTTKPVLSGTAMANMLQKRLNALRKMGGAKTRRRRHRH